MLVEYTEGYAGSLHYLIGGELLNSNDSSTGSACVKIMDRANIDDRCFLRENSRNQFERTAASIDVRA